MSRTKLSDAVTQCVERTARWPHERCRQVALSPRVRCFHHETPCAMCNRGMGPHSFRGKMHGLART